MSAMVSVPTVARIAANVFKESVRDKVLYSIVLFAVIVILASLLLGQLTAGQEVKIIKDLGLSAISLFGHFIAIFIGIGLVSKEVERRSIYALLAKPVSRSQFIAGKYAGLLLTLAANVAVMTIALYAVLGYMTVSESAEFRAGWEAPGMDPALLVAILLIFCELAVVTAIALFFSSFSTPLVSAGLTLALWAIGHFNADLRNVEGVVESRPVAWLARVLYHLMPDFAAFDVKSQVVHGLVLPPAYVASTIAYAVAYIACLLVLATVIFSRRDFK
jgi:ABC-type transport system involved in multi-copper enzyme maturation permease subunit